MSLGTKTDNSLVALTSTLTSTLLAAPATNLKRYVKHVKIINTGPATTVTIGQHAAAGAPAATDAGIWCFQESIAANGTIEKQWGGDGFEMLAGGNPITGGCAVASGVSMHIMAVLVPA